jgi:hypothetical protein
VTSSELAPLVSGASVMLAGLGFFYNAVKDRIDEALELGTNPQTDEERASRRKKAKSAFWTVLPLAIASVVVCVLLAPQTKDELKSGHIVPFRSGYSTLDAIFVVMAVAWLAVALFFAWRTVKLGEKWSDLK